MVCPFIDVPSFEGVKIDFECPCVDRLEDPNDNFSCEDCPHYRCVVSQSF